MADAAAGAALGGVAGAAIGGPAGAVAGAALGAAVAQGSVPGKRGTVASPRMIAAQAGKTKAKAGKGKPKEPPRMGAMAAIRKEIGDRLAARGEDRLKNRRPGEVRFARRVRRGPDESLVGFVRPSTPHETVTDGDEPGSSIHSGNGAGQTRSNGGRLNKISTSLRYTKVPKSATDSDDPGGTPGAPQPETKPTQEGPVNTSPTPISSEYESPSSDGQFLDTLTTIIRQTCANANAVSEWETELIRLGLDRQVIDNVKACAEHLAEASASASKAAASFEAVYEDVRQVAGRGMQFRGEDAA